ncbi:putative C6 transcription factor (AmyR) [Aspergillus lucknowensis]|uniref:Fungal-specific transcription factor domain-containing protein n=1 Tax=Aspergillus lucknowensis TaxID=176173 RepID=A0ABR4M202_9EURO
MDSRSMSLKQKSFKQACDNCRRRKIKCSRELPCDKCQRLLLSCSYSDVLRRKGPKFRTLYPLAPIHPLVARQRQFVQCDAQQYSADREWFADPTSYPLGGSPTSPSFTLDEPQYMVPELPESCARLPPPELVSSPDSAISYTDSPPAVLLPSPRVLTPPVLLAHVNVYLKYMFPIMPVVRREELQQDCHHPGGLSSQRYAFLASLCAATHIQLKLDGANTASDCSLSQMGADGSSLMSGEELLTEAVRARKECDPIEDMNIESLLTSFFLFAAYGNLDRQDHAWFYLCQATSMIFSLGLHRELTYSELNIEEAEQKRRVFWLLFITERGYALQQAKPVMLRNSIHKPQVLCSDDPILAYGFINLIGVFENLSSNLYDWVSVGGGEGSLEMPPTSAIQASLSKPISLEGVSEIQKVDILITQQWLQGMMWKLSMTRASQPGSRSETVLPFHLPVSVAKAVLSVIAEASQGSVDAHGIGMEQKLFDLGVSVADVSRSLSTKASHSLAESTIEARELLWGILNTLSRIRGSQSYLLPSLLERSKGLLNFDCSLSTSNFLPPLPPSTSSEPIRSWPASEDSHSRAANNTWENPSVSDDLHDNNDLEAY